LRNEVAHENSKPTSGAIAATYAVADGAVLRQNLVSVNRTIVGAQLSQLLLLLQDFKEWRDPDSNRGHHDFQSYSEVLRYAVNPYR
jgi:hypothetical protein